MKKNLFSIGLVSLILIIGLALAGCSKGGGSPSSIARQFYAALEKSDSKAIGELMTPDAAATMLVFAEKAKGMIAAKGSIKSTKETINGNTAVVKATFTDGSTEELNFVKVDGKWKVTIEK